MDERHRRLRPRLLHFHSFHILESVSGSIHATHVEIVSLEVDCEFGKMLTHPCEVLYIPGGAMNLISVQHLRESDITPD